MITSDIKTAKKAIAQYGYFHGYFYDQSINYVQRIKFIGISNDNDLVSEDTTYDSKDVFLKREEATQMAIVTLSERINILVRNLYVSESEGE
jgi:hypothetical protein